MSLQYWYYSDDFKAYSRDRIQFMRTATFQAALDYIDEIETSDSEEKYILACDGDVLGCYETREEGLVELSRVPYNVAFLNTVDQISQEGVVNTSVLIWYNFNSVLPIY